MTTSTCHHISVFRALDRNLARRASLTPDNARWSHGALSAIVIRASVMIEGKAILAPRAVVAHGVNRRPRRYHRDGIQNHRQGASITLAKSS